MSSSALASLCSDFFAGCIYDLSIFSHPSGCPSTRVVDGLPVEMIIEPLRAEGGSAYCKRMRRRGEWGTAAEILALSAVLRRPITVYRRENGTDSFAVMASYSRPGEPTEEALNPLPLTILYANDSHYMALLPRDDWVQSFLSSSATRTSCTATTSTSSAASAAAGRDRCRPSSKLAKLPRARGRKTPQQIVDGPETPRPAQPRGAQPSYPPWGDRARGSPAQPSRAQPSQCKNSTA